MPSLLLLPKKGSSSVFGHPSCACTSCVPFRAGASAESLPTLPCFLQVFRIETWREREQKHQRRKAAWKRHTAAQAEAAQGAVQALPISHRGEEEGEQQGEHHEKQQGQGGTSHNAPNGATSPASEVKLSGIGASGPEGTAAGGARSTSGWAAWRRRLACAGCFMAPEEVGLGRQQTWRLRRQGSSLGLDRDYDEAVAERFERICVSLLFVAYTVVIILIFSLQCGYIELFPYLK